MDIDWSRLMALPRWTPLAELGLDMVHLGGVLYKISPSAYLTCVRHDDEFREVRECLVTTVSWAASDGAARRAHLMEIEADDLTVAIPPAALLPGPDCKSYGNIVRALRRGDRAFDEWADYRIATDGAFIHRTLSALPYVFQFRRPEEDRDEICYSIQYRLPK